MNFWNLVLEYLMRTTTLKREKFLWRALLRDNDVLHHSKVLPVTRVLYYRMELCMGTLERMLIIPLAACFFIGNYAGKESRGSEPVPPTTYLSSCLQQFLSEFFADCLVGFYGPVKPYQSTAARLRPDILFIMFNCCFMCMGLLWWATINNAYVGRTAPGQPCIMRYPVGTTQCGRYVKFK